MSLADQIKIDAIQVCSQTGDFAELITYVSLTLGTIPNVPCNVLRQLPSAVDEAQNATAASIEIYIPASIVPKVDTGGDYVILAYRPGGAVGNWMVNEIINPDGGMWQVRARGAG